MDTSEAINHISLCAGYGGIDLGLRRVFPTCRTVAYVEIEAFAVANLVAKMEEGELDQAPIWTNLKTLPLEAFPTGLEIISGGFPCQPFSAAGKREGDEDPRHLFPYIKNAIRTIQPRIVFLENVEGIISAKLKGDGWEDPAGTPVLLHVLRELERVGYRATAGVFSAAEVGATHQRKRVFILANRCGAGLERFSPSSRCNSERWQEPVGHIGTGGLPHRKWPARPGEAQHEWEEPRVVADSASNGARRAAGKCGQKAEGQGGTLSREPNGSSEEPRVVGDAEGRQIHGGKSGELGEAAQRGESESTTVADPSAELADPGHPEPSGRDEAQEGQLRIPRCESTPQDCGDQHTGQAEPIMGGATDGPTSGVDATINRVDRLRLLGNGVVPDTAEVAFRTLYKELMDEQQSNQS